MDKRKLRLQAFASLIWYEETIRFLFKFISITSELLLGIGLVLSTVNFLSDGGLMPTGSLLATAWAWAQAVAIDSSLGVTFSIVFQTLKERDWLKMSLYGVLLLMLALVAAIITNIDTSSHALRISMTAATAQIGPNVHLLIVLRALAVVGFMILAPLKDVSFKDLYVSGKTKLQLKSATMVQTNETKGAQEQSVLENEVTSMNAADPVTAQLIQVLLTLAKQQGTGISEDQRHLLVDLLVPHETVPDSGGCSSSSSSQDGAIQAQMEPESDEAAPFEEVGRTIELESQARSFNGTEEVKKMVELELQAEVHMTREPHQPVPTASEEVGRIVALEPQAKSSSAPTEALEHINGRSDDTLGTREEKIAHAFQQLERERKRISARELASHSHIHRATCNNWLRTHHPDLLRPVPGVSKKRKLQESQTGEEPSVQKKSALLKGQRQNPPLSPSKSGSGTERVELGSTESGSGTERMELESTENGAKEIGTGDSTLPSKIEILSQRNNFSKNDDEFEFERMAVEGKNVLQTNSWSASKEELIAEALKYMEILEGEQYGDEAVIREEQKEWEFNGYKEKIRQNFYLARLSMVNTLMQHFFPDDKYGNPKNLGKWFNTTFGLYTRQKNPLKPSAEMVSWAKSSHSPKQIAQALRQERDIQKQELGPWAGPLQRPWADGATRYGYLEADPLQDETSVYNDEMESRVQQANDVPHPPLDLQARDEMESGVQQVNDAPHPPLDLQARDEMESGVQQVNDAPHPPLDLQDAYESRNASPSKHVKIIAHEVGNSQEMEVNSSSFPNTVPFDTTEENRSVLKTHKNALWWADQLARYLDPNDKRVEIVGPVQGCFTLALHSKTEGTNPDILVDIFQIRKRFFKLFGDWQQQHTK